MPVTTNTTPKAETLGETSNYLLKEDGGKLLKEDGGGLLLESSSDHIQKKQRQANAGITTFTKS
jgi:hypothetical protein